MDNHYLTNEEELTLVDSLQVGNTHRTHTSCLHCHPLCFLLHTHVATLLHGSPPCQVCAEDGWLPLLYRCRAKKYLQGGVMDTQLALLEGAPRPPASAGQAAGGALLFSTSSPREEPPSGAPCTRVCLGLQGCHYAS